ncbi:uncharacterized protein LOC143809527 [Ranitomeya variabilis]|uniref:uncharacterized protein LOC143809527 n=1 Tax=Ranitomeya variabilis TaxID=490064 RepID=UPI0040570BE9
MYLTCPVCYKVTERLDKHLHDHCMKLNSAKERTDAMDSARERVRIITSKGTTMDEEEILSFGTAANMIPFLEDRGFLILRKPSTARTVQVEEKQSDKGPSEACEETEVAQESERIQRAPEGPVSDPDAPHTRATSFTPVIRIQRAPEGPVSDPDAPHTRATSFTPVIRIQRAPEGPVSDPDAPHTRATSFTPVIRIQRAPEGPVSDPDAPHTRATSFTPVIRYVLKLKEYNKIKIMLIKN